MLFLSYRLLLLLPFIMDQANCVLECLDHVPLYRFYRVRSCHRSKSRIIGARNVLNLTECANFAKQRNALAFNFSPTAGAGADKNRQVSYAASCQILGCPEIGNMSTLVSDIDFDYYSAFANLNASENATCIKSVGLFVLITDKKNYTEAISVCQTAGGDLAHVISETRTNTLSSLVSNGIAEWYKAAYVGLDDTGTEGVFETPLGAPLTCFKFRAWGPSQPRSKSKRDDCVILDNERTWKVVNCKHKLPFICELYPEEVQQTEEISERPNCTKVKDRSKLRKCVEKQRMFEIMQNSSRADICALID